MASIGIIVEDNRFLIGGFEVGISPLCGEIEDRLSSFTSRINELEGDVGGVPFHRRAVIFDEVGISFCHNVDDSKVIWVMAHLNLPDRRRRTQNCPECPFEGLIRFGSYTLNRSIRWKTYLDVVDDNRIEGLTIHCAPSDCGLISCVTVGFPCNDS